MTKSDLISREAVKAEATSFFGHSVVFANRIDKIPSEEPTAEEVWSVAQKVFHSTLTYREAVDYVKELEKQHERFNQQNRCD